MSFKLPSPTGSNPEALFGWAQSLISVLKNKFSSIQTTAGGSSVIIPSGTVFAFGGGTLPTGWYLCNGGTRNRLTDSALFAVIGTDYGGGDGSTTFNLPDFTGRTLLGEGGGHLRGNTGGAETHTLTTAEIPAHTHGITDPSHTHAFTGTAHNHAITDPGHAHSFTPNTHTHTVTDAGHTHAGVVVATGAGEYGGPPATGSVGSTSSATTGVAVDAASANGTVGSNTTGVTTNNTTATGSNAAASTGITADSAGGGTAHSIMQPFAVVNFMIKA